MKLKTHRYLLMAHWKHYWNHYTGGKILKLFQPKIGKLYHHAPKRMDIPPHYYKKPPQPVNQLWPSVSIVTPAFQHGLFIETTLKSVLDQQYSSLEYVVKDGGSLDNTVGILKRYESQLAYWESRPDNGQSQAINIGFSHTSGEIMAYLNSDDLLLPGSLHYVAQYFQQHPEVDVVYGHRILIDDNGDEIGRWVLPPHQNEVLSWADYIPQETLFWRRNLWEKINGHINENFQFAMDWDLILRFREISAKFVRLPRFLGAFRVHSSQKSSAKIHDIGLDETTRIQKRCHGRHVTHEEINLNTRSYLKQHQLFHYLYKMKILRY